MAETEKTIRLNKAAKEFNLSMDHIVDFLSKKGFKIESNPNTKLPGDAYTLLLKEFQGDKSAKEEALQFTQSKIKKESAFVLEAEDRPKAISKKDDDSNEILIKNMDSGSTTKESSRTKEPVKAPKDSKEKEKEKEKEVKIEEPPAKEKEPTLIKAKADKMEGPKVVGKIEIPEKPKRKSKKEEEEESAAKKTKAKKAY